MYSEKKISIIIVVCLIVFVSIIHYSIVDPLKSLPSPLYGGDYYYQLGATNHVKYGGSPLDSPNIQGALPVYFVLYPAITGNIAKIFSIDAISSEFLFSYIIVILSAIVMFFLAKKIFKNVFISAILPIIFILPGYMPVIKYTEFAYLLMMPLLLLQLYYFINRPSYINSVFLGLVYGLVGLTHSVAFIASSILLGFAFLYYVIYRWHKSRQLKLLFKKRIIFYLIVLLIGISIAMLWWYEPVFVYYGQTSPHYTEWNNENWDDKSFQFNFLKGTIKGKFFNFSGWFNVSISLLTILGLISLFLFKDKKENDQSDAGNASDADSERVSGFGYVKFLLISSLIITFHYFITQNFFNFHLIPGYISYLLLSPVMAILAMCGIYFLSVVFEKIKIKRNVLYCVLIAVFVVNSVVLIGARGDDQWYNNGKQTAPAQYEALSAHLNKNSGVNDVILTSKELGFAVNAFSGRKLLSSRRAHNDPFLDMDPREMAQAIILYGNSTGIKKEMLKKYDVKYLYWDYYWIESEYTIKENKVTNKFDPTVVFYSEENQKMFEDNDIKYIKDNTWVDPALVGDNYKKFDLLFLSPENYRTYNHPWNPNLDEFLKEVWSYDAGGKKAAVLYEIIYEDSE